MRRGAIALLVGALLAVPATAGAALPPVKHVFVIVLENKDYASSFGPSAVSKQLPALASRGVLLTQYYGTAHNSLPNYIAMVSGQGPNVVTQSDCQIYQEFLPGTIGSDGQALGAGCVYPATVKTVADQLDAAKLSWGGYMEDMATPCQHPALNSPDSTQTATATSQYAARHNPFVYFHSLIDAPTCAAHDVALDRLQTALDTDTVPNLTFITPDLCSDGHDATCANPAQQGGYTGIDDFLSTWVPKIRSSAAYQRDGALIITFDESESGAEGCCVTDHPDTPNPGATTVGPGGGRVGTVVLSPFVTPGTTTATQYNHYSLLRTVEDLFGLGHLGYAARSTAFGTDVFNAPAPAAAHRRTRHPRRARHHVRRRHH